MTNCLLALICAGLLVTCSLKLATHLAEIVRARSLPSLGEPQLLDSAEVRSSLAGLGLAIGLLVVVLYF